MHLKTLSIVGFKSFADRTRIECEPGVTVIVGPNGSGKSNLVDAIAWVMGTQATTTLRTQRMDDVIFAGTATRPALGRAEVSLTFDNSMGLLDLDMSEVTISRRLFRDGTSEYEVNGVACRLLDIQELLADSGVGRHQHVIVGQGRIDDVLNAAPQDHRAVIEEAAGVIKHRRRRERTVSRLEATDRDIVRARELLGEEEKRLRPLKRQANAAERHGAVRAEWRALHLWWGGEKLRGLRGRRDELARLEETVRRRLDGAVEEREGLTAQIVEMQEAAGGAGEALERDRAAAGRLEATAERLQTIALVARERRLGIERDALGGAERRQALTAELTDVETNIEAATTEERQATEAADRASTMVRGLEDEERSLADADRLPAEGMAASLRGDLAALEAAALRDDRERGDLTRRRAAVSAVMDQEAAEARRLADEVAALAGDLAAAESALGEAAARAASDAGNEAEALTRWRSAEARAAAAQARLEALEAARDGFADPEARRRVSSAGSVIGLVIDRLDVPAELLLATAAALGPWADGFVASDRDAVGRVAGDLKSAGLGGVALVAVDEPESTPAREVAAAFGLEALVDRLGPRGDSRLAASLLGDVVIAEGWAAARAIVAAHPEIRAVTPEGDLITRVGMVAAHPDGAGSAAVEAARIDSDRAANELARERSHHATAKRAIATSSEAERAAESAVEVIRRRRAGAEEAARLVGRSMAEHQAEIERLDGRLRTLSEEAAARLDRTEQLRSRLGDFDDADSDGHLAWEDSSRRRAEVVARREEAQHQRDEATSRLAAATERRSLLTARRDELTAALAATHPRESTASEALAVVEERARVVGQIVRKHLDALRAREPSLRSELGTAGDRLDSARERREALGIEIETAREELSRMAVESAEIKVRLEATAEALRREADAAEEEALAAPRPDLDEGADPEAELESLAASLRRLGPVNPLAAAEYEELSTRVTFMQEQLADLESSRAELRTVIRAVDEEITRLFLEAFEEISATFAENVAVLFPGGTGRLSLTDPDDPMTTGVDVHAQPMGKKVGRLSLLSGGERSLAALAFLFAVFKARPSPFYVLDEVEAALDDANLRRFLRLVDSARGNSQLLIVTHQQQTMEAGDILYGVTMEPGESSKVFAKRLATADRGVGSSSGRNR
ncbi:MAG TPA: chromosome segregation protein SMC [Acidimicrobiia bacterium]|nr:chromosome segregation protein SMC [Acidimicrobiia bacterium]